MLPLRSTDMRSMLTPSPKLVVFVASGFAGAGACAHAAAVVPSTAAQNAARMAVLIHTSATGSLCERGSGVVRPFFFVSSTPPGHRRPRLAGLGHGALGQVRDDQPGNSDQQRLDQV